MNAKKFYVLIVLGALVVLGASACGSDETATASASAQSSENSDTTESDADPVGGGDASSWISTPSREAPAQDGTVEVQVNGMQRSYRLYVPFNQPDGGMPLLIALHGGSGRAEPFPQQAKFSQLAESEGVVIAYPLAELMPGNEGEWQLNTRADSRHDLDFIEALIDDVGTYAAVDSRRIYATGYSLGSMFSYELACHLSERFAAIASFAGTMPVQPDSCEPSESMGIMHLHGYDDDLIAYGNSWDWKDWDSVGTMMDIPSLISYWANKFNCQNEAQDDSSNSVHFVHDVCDGGARVEHHRVRGVGHEWPETIGGISTHALIWRFFLDFSK